MKTLTISVLAVFLLLSSCNIKSDNGFPYNVTPKAGTGIIKNKEYKMSFDEIRVAQSISAEVVKSDEEKVVITAPSDILDYYCPIKIQNYRIVLSKVNRIV